ncbi:hypothetical protein IFVP177_C2170299 [Vibrio parahaemolyticus]
MALEDVLQYYEPPDIFNSGQGCEFTSTELHEVAQSGGYGSAWTEKAAGLTIFLLSNYDEVCNTRRFT